VFWKHGDFGFPVSISKKIVDFYNGDNLGRKTTIHGSRRTPHAGKGHVAPAVKSQKCSQIFRFENTAITEI
jgi:hypothetical protein